MHLAPINPITIALLFFLPFDVFRLILGPVLISGVLDNFGYQFALLMTNLQSSLGLVIFIFFVRWKVTSSVAKWLPAGRSFSSKQLHFLSCGFFVLYMIAFLYLTQKTGGLLDWLLEPRRSYLEKRDGNGLYYSAALNFLSLSFFFFGFSTNSKHQLTVVSFLFIVAVYFFGSKGFILNFFVFYFVILFRLGYKRMPQLFLTLLPVVFGLLAINFFSMRQAVDFQSIAEYFDYYTNAAMYYEDYFSGSISLFAGQVWLTSFWEYIPRSLYDAKPYVYGMLHVTDIYFPGGAESGNTPAFGGGVAEFADFGVFGIIFSSLFNYALFFKALGYIYIFRLKAFSSEKSINLTQLFVCMLFFAPVLGTFLPIGLFASFLLCSWLYSIFILKVRNEFIFISKYRSL